GRRRPGRRGRRAHSGGRRRCGRSRRRRGLPSGERRLHVRDVASDFVLLRRAQVLGAPHVLLEVVDRPVVLLELLLTAGDVTEVFGANGGYVQIEVDRQRLVVVPLKKGLGRRLSALLVRRFVPGSIGGDGGAGQREDQ